MSFTVKFSLRLEWKDERLIFYNLNENPQSNIIDEQNKDKIWIPPLIFNNTFNNLRIKNEESANIFVKKEGNHRDAPLSRVDEDYYYTGSENVLMFHNDYSLELHCNLDLQNYPFDTQTCAIQANTNFSQIYCILIFLIIMFVAYFINIDAQVIMTEIIFR